MSVEHLSNVDRENWRRDELAELGRMRLAPGQDGAAIDAIVRALGASFTHSDDHEALGAIDAIVAMVRPDSRP